MMQKIDPATIFRNVNGSKRVIVAVSGGSDSMALLHLSALWSGINKVDLRVVTVDHGLRPEAAAEAAFVAGVSEGLGLPHVTLAWEGIKPSTGISEAARKARYLLIEEFARDIGAEEVLIGHTSDDQAETVWMRNLRIGNSPQWRGLSGMAEQMLLPSGVMVYRPLLAIDRQTLRDYLADIGQSWIEDPSNLDESYERVRARRDLLKSEVTKEQICRLADLSGRQRKLAAETVTNLLVSELVVTNGPVFEIERALLGHLVESHCVLAIQLLVAIAGGKEHLIPVDVAREILGLHASDRRTAGNAIVESHGTIMRFFRENRNLPVVHIGPGDRAIWDNRLLVKNRSDNTYTCSAVSKGQLSAMEEELGGKLDVKPRAALHSTPVLSGGDGRLTLPFVLGRVIDNDLELRFKVPAIENFCSQYDFALLRLVDHVRNNLDATIAKSG
ncbi:MAG: tRNA lysidine(34) synthetase TilS [Rhizobiaceae bacterium]